MTRLTILAAMLSLLWVMPAAASESTYSTLSSTDFFSKYCTVQQPDDALPLQSMSVSLTKAAQTDNYSGGYYNLPRLRSGYYYKIYDGEHKDKFEIPNTVYPVLKLAEDIEVNDTAKLGIFAVGNDTTPVQSWTLLGPAGGLDAATDDTDCSAGFKDTLYPKLSDTQQLNYYDTETNSYNHALHKYGFVTKDHMVLAGLPSSIVLNDEIKLENGRLQPVMSGVMFDENSYKGSLPVYVESYPYRFNDLDYKNSESWDFNKILSHDVSNSDSGFAIYYSDYENIAEGSYVSGVFKESGASSDVYFIAVTNEALYAYTTAGASSISKDSQQSVTGDPEEVTVTYNKQFDLRFVSDDIRLPFMNPYAELPGNVKPSDYKLTPTTQWSDSIQVSSKLPGGAYHPSVSLLKYDNSEETFSVTFESNEGSSVRSETYKVHSLPAAAELPVPNRQYYTFGGWYTDSALSNPYSPDTFSAEPGGSYTFYAKWDYSGGTYHVVFYDRKRNTSTAADFSGDTQPTFPTIDPYQGYSFKCWEVLATPDSSSGTQYDPMTFKPVPGNTYHFNAVFATSGIIKSVTNTKDTYYIGDNVDKGHLSVVVQTDDAGTTRTISPSEFTVSPSTLSVNGSNTVTITYTATGAQATIMLTAVQDTVTSVSAEYTGSSLSVGASINKSDIKVTRRYRSGKTDTTTDFTMTPSTVQSVGSNSIRISSSGYSTSVTVTGLRVPASTGNGSGNTTISNKTVKSLSAVYTGNQLYVGDTIRSSDISVTATYEDGSTGALSSSMFSYTPSYIRNAGTNTITVVYNGVTTSFTVDALESSTVTSSSSSSASADSESSSRPSSTSSSSSSSASSSSGSESGGTLSSQSSGDKTTSKGYLGGSNVLTSGINMNTSMSDSRFVNEVDIMAAIESASDEAEYISIDLINMAEGNTITADMFKALADRELTMQVNMLDPDTNNRIAVWTVNGSKLDSESEFQDFEPNIVMEEIDKSSETMVFVQVYDATVYNDIESLDVNLSDFYSVGDMLTVYKTNSFGASSSLLFDTAFSAGTVGLPLASAPFYMITNATVQYPDGSDMRTLDVMAEMETTTEETETEDTDMEDTTIVTIESEQTSRRNSALPIIIAVVVVVLAAVGTAIGIIVRKKMSEKYDDTFDVEDEGTDQDSEEELPTREHYDYQDEDDDDIY